MEIDIEVLDPQLALAGVGGDQQFFADLAGIAQAAWPELLRQISKAVSNGNPNAALPFVHLVKVTTENLCAKRSLFVAIRLEKMIIYGDPEGYTQAFTDLNQELEVLREAITQVSHG